eukprot:CAMPEP_0198288394 /NCGR_PEP_ID=MMETSP1449-20131203/6896_1 /TAXON_ID=420275 /ORGANISM="Attheya septentrionalis, Strain CCMP2084" /LENGTH=936 /DNA_ID=CAMNT_0043986513 /DNA_START=68 /DNA_END=2878 /DNA_ORIENTATION=-
MVAIRPYPGMRQRTGGQGQGEGQANNAQGGNNPNANANANANAMMAMRTSHMYCILSAVLAILAIVTSAGQIPAVNTLTPVGLMPVILIHSDANANTNSNKNKNTRTPADALSVEAVARAAVAAVSAGEAQARSAKDRDHQRHAHALIRPDSVANKAPLFSWNKEPYVSASSTYAAEAEANTDTQEPQKAKATIFSWPWLSQPSVLPAPPVFTASVNIDKPFWSRLSSLLQSLLDPSISSPASVGTRATQIIDKILTSTPRLLAIANLLLAITYLLHSAVADAFLSTAGTATGTGTGRGMDTDTDTDTNTSMHRQIHRLGREKMGGFLVFKLLLISAVVAPDTLDLLILLTWYTLLAFLRSLAHLASATTAHTSQSGQPPRPGVLHLLLVVLCSNVTAAACCVALFHGAGWGMVLLLTCDCALLALQVLCHIARHAGQALEFRHGHAVQSIEDQQLRLHNDMRSASANANANANANNENNQTNNDATSSSQQDHGLPYFMYSEEAQMESRQLDQQMELMEAAHTRYLSMLDTIVFFLEVFANALTVAHFLHIWSLHGMQFTLIDGVLALHLHSALAAAAKKISERRNLNRIARDLDGFFRDATELEMRKTSAAGDVCCICLGTMSTGNVKKVGCGHLYHTHCLREVVERARSIEAARCPLCRASVVDGQHHPVQNSNNNSNTNNNINLGGAVGLGNNNNTGIAQNTGLTTTTTAAATANANPNDDFTGGAQQQQDGNANGNNDRPQQLHQQPRGNNNGGGGVEPQNINTGEHALFRFSTEGILPAWLPLPAFSFEVVRRPPVVPDTAAAVAAPPEPANRNNPAGNQQAGANAGAINNNDQQNGVSFWRRLLQLAGTIPMSPQEEAIAADQLVDMFPQYDRADLLRELRSRGSSEAVAESILLGLFTGVPRGGAIEEHVNMGEEEADRQGNRGRPII